MSSDTCTLHFHQLEELEKLSLNDFNYFTNPSVYVKSEIIIPGSNAAVFDQLIVKYFFVLELVEQLI